MKALRMQVASLLCSGACNSRHKQCSLLQKTETKPFPLISVPFSTKVLHVRGKEEKEGMFSVCLSFFNLMKQPRIGTDW